MYGCPMRAVAMAALTALVVLFATACGASRPADTAASQSKARHRSHAIAPAGIAGVGLDMSPRRVRRILGAPTSSRVRLPHRFASVDLIYRYGKLEVEFVRGQRGEHFVYLVSTTDPVYRTLTGLGVGSSERVVRAVATTCVVTHQETACGITNEQAGAVLSFELRRGRVFRVSVFAPPF